MDSPVEGARLMAMRGMAVFPLRPGTKKPYKGFRWTRQASRDLQQINKWAAQYGGCNWGVLTTGFAVIDADLYKGCEAIESLLELGELPETFQVETPSGGLHYYFNGIDASNNPLAPSIDVRSRNGYVVAPGSRINGDQYTIVKDAPFAGLPDHIKARLGTPYRSAGGGQIAGEHIDTDINIKVAIEHTKSTTGAIQGQRERALYQLACEIKDLGVTDGLCLDMVSEHWNPRCEPPLYDGEIERVVLSAYRNGKEPLGINAPSANFEPLDGDWIDATIRNAKTPRVGTGKWWQKRADPSTLPQRPWIAYKYLLRGQVTMLVAPGGVGKSSLTLGWAIALSLGKGESLNMDVRGRQKVLIVNNEDDADEIERRVSGYCLHHGIDEADLSDWLCVWVAQDAFVALQQDPQRRQIKTDAFKALTEFCASNDIDVVIFDPLVELHQADENDNQKMAEVMQAFRNLARKQNAAVLLVHHSRKPPQASAAGQAGESDTSRGASSIVNNARLTLTLFRMTAAEAKPYGIDEPERMRYVRIDRSKGNYTPPDRDTVWMETITVPLANGEDSHAMAIADLRQKEELELAELIQPLIDHLIEAGDGGIARKKAAHIIFDDPFSLVGCSQRTIERRLDEALASPKEYAGHTIELIKASTRRWCVRIVPAKS